MEKIKNNKKRIIIIGIVIFILILAIIIVVISNKNTDNNKSKPEESYYSNKLYNYSDKEKEPDNTKRIETAKMRDKHCINDVCITNVVMYYADGTGRITYDITNNSKKKVTGYLRMNFGSNNLVIYYEDVKSGKTAHLVSYFSEMSFENVSDYKLEELSEEELSKIIVR